MKMNTICKRCSGVVVCVCVYIQIYTHFLSWLQVVDGELDVHDRKQTSPL